MSLRWKTFVMVGLILAALLDRLCRGRLEAMVAARTAALTASNQQLRQEVARQQRLAASLRLSEEKFSKAFHTSPDSINLNRLKDGLYLEVNEGFTRLTGYTAADVAGKSSLDIDIWANPADRDRLVQALAAHGQVKEFEASFRLKDGTVRVGMMSARLIEVAGEPCILSITRDIDDRKRMEAEKEKLQAQFLQAQKMEAIGRLTAGIAHDFNNLLTAINGFAALIQAGLAADDPHRADLDRILNSGRRAADLVRRLLIFSRKHIVEPQLLDLNTVIAELDKMLRRIIGEDIELSLCLDPGLWPVKFDLNQVEQVIVNLVVNARDAMPAGGRLAIATANTTLAERDMADHPEIKSGQYVRLTVRDSGTGMSSEVKAHLFEPFFTTKEPGEGTGLGLATIFGSVTQAGGDIRVDSEEGQGTIFEIYLPRAQETVRPQVRPAAAALTPAGSETVLLVEDDPTVRALVRYVLAGLGYTVVEASSGPEARQVLARHPIDLLLTDVVMPGDSGLVLAGQLRQALPGLKVLFMSGYTADLNKYQGIPEQPEMAFLPKPFTPDALARKVRQVLDG